MITAEVSVYPLKTSDATCVINESIGALNNNSNITCSVNSMNTRITGSKDEIFKSLNDMFSKAEETGGEISMVVTMTNAAQ